MTTAYAEAILARVVPELGPDPARWFSGEVLAAALHLLDEARAERDRLRHRAEFSEQAEQHLRNQVTDLAAERDRLADRITQMQMELIRRAYALAALEAQVQRVEYWVAVRIGTAIGRPYAVEVRAALTGSTGWTVSLAGRVDGEVPS